MCFITVFRLCLHLKLLCWFFINFKHSWEQFLHIRSSSSRELADKVSLIRHHELIQVYRAAMKSFEEASHGQSSIKNTMSIGNFSTEVRRRLFAERRPLRVGFVNPTGTACYVAAAL